MTPAVAAFATPDEPPGLRIVMVDDELVVVDKPSGMPSVPARTALDPPDVATVLAAGFGPLEAAHRLDRDTSGLLVLARSREVRGLLGRAFEAGRVGKRYLAVVEGSLPRDSGVIHLPLADDVDRPPRKRVDPILGRRATTRWRVLAEADSAGPSPRRVSLVELEPVTGRSHQLRVHLAWLGCPISGDRLYGRDANPPAPLALHAASIVFPHPRTGLPVSLVAASPAGAVWRSFTMAAACGQRGTG